MEKTDIRKLDEYLVDLLAVFAPCHIVMALVRALRNYDPTPSNRILADRLELLFKD